MLTKHTCVEYHKTALSNAANVQGLESKVPVSTTNYSFYA
jgi:hypothetical protein